MLCFWRMGTMQKFAAVHGSIHHHFDQQRQLISRQTDKTNRSATMAG